MIITNRKAKRDYEVLETYEAGMVLEGTEVKSLRQGRANLKDSFARVEQGEVFLHNMHISPYPNASRFNHDPDRKRKLLLHRWEIKRLLGKTAEKGFTLVPLKVYFKGKVAKVELGLCKGKKLYDKRREIAEREVKRDLERRLKRGYD